MRIAITFLTCGRIDYSSRTLDTLQQFNPRLRDDFILLHGDDVSTKSEAAANRKLAAVAGFATVVSPDRRLGVARMTELLFRQAEDAGADAVLNLQNDWECLRPIPIPEIWELLGDPGIYNVRMYGEFKSATGRCGIHHGGRSPRRIVDWKDHPTIPGYQVGEIHWGHPPAVTRIHEARMLTINAGVESESFKRSGSLTTLTARVKSNVFNHIGRDRTQGFKS